MVESAFYKSSVEIFNFGIERLKSGLVGPKMMRRLTKGMWLPSPFPQRLSDENNNRLEDHC